MPSVDPVIPGPGAYDIPSPEKEASAISMKGVQQTERKDKGAVIEFYTPCALAQQ